MWEATYEPALMLTLKVWKVWRVFTQSTHLTSRSCQFFLKESHLGQNRARCCIQQLRDLNPRVRVSAHTGPLHDDDLLLQFQVGSGLSGVLQNFQNNFLSSFAQRGSVLRLKVVVLTDSSLDDQKRLGDFCHAHGIRFVVADTKGLCGWVGNVEDLPEWIWTNTNNRRSCDFF